VATLRAVFDNTQRQETETMVRMSFTIGLHYEIADLEADFIFNIHAAHTSRQSVVSEQLTLSQPLQPEIYTDPTYGSRYMRLKAGAGILDVNYQATVAISHYFAAPDTLAEIPISQHRPEVLPYIYPSRYCQSDRLHKFAVREFGGMPHGYSRVQAIRDWVHSRTRFMTGTSNSTTSAVDTIIEGVGVCRDFAHVMIALCRAVNIPARFVTGIDYGADPSLGPMDFHAYVEVFLSDRWYLFDPTDISPPMGLVRLGTGRDAADVSFATMFGAVRTSAPVISIQAMDDPNQELTLPWRCPEAVSTYGGPEERQPDSAGKGLYVETAPGLETAVAA
jgi:transglutaminase-like putative cysteine protease